MWVGEVTQREPGIPAERTRPFPECLAAGAREAPLFTRLTPILRDGAAEHVFHPMDEPGGHAGQALDWLKGNP